MRQRVASVDELPVGALRRVVVDATAICIARVADATVYAIADTCTHEQASLAEGVIDDAEVECPMHFSRFDLRTGAVTAPPAVEPARTFPVTIEGADVFIDV